MSSRKPKTNLRDKLPVEALVRFYTLLATVAPNIVSPVAPEEEIQYSSTVAEKDAHVVAAAVRGEAAYLVTLDRKHLANAEVRGAGLPIQTLSAQSPLVVGTTAETWVPELTGAITRTIESALALKPDLAPAYFLRGWARYLADPAANRAQARADVDRAAALVPDDALYRDAAAYLTGGSE